MKYAHFLYVPFTGLGVNNGYRGDKWLQSRIEIFKRFVLPSLSNQTNQNFVVWFSWRPEDSGNEIVQAFVRSLDGIRDFNHVHTFGGLMFWDDKYDDTAAAERLKDALVRTLPVMEPWVQGRDVLMTIQPSDDMYLATMVEDVQRYFYTHPDKQAVGYKKGYIMYYGTKEIAEYSCEPWTTDSESTYHTDTNPPFYTIKFKPDVFLDPGKHFQYIGPYKSHEYVQDFLKMGFLDYRGFVVGTHGVNISTVWTHRYKGRMLTEDERSKILISTGTLFAEPFAVTQSFRLFVRGIYNKMPLQGLLRWLYRKLPQRYQTM